MIADLCFPSLSPFRPAAVEHVDDGSGASAVDVAFQGLGKRDSSDEADHLTSLWTKRKEGDSTQVPHELKVILLRYTVTLRLLLGFRKRRNRIVGSLTVRLDNGNVSSSARCPGGNVCLGGGGCSSKRWCEGLFPSYDYWRVDWRRCITDRPSSNGGLGVQANGEKEQHGHCCSICSLTLLTSS